MLRTGQSVVARQWGLGTGVEAGDKELGRRSVDVIRMNDAAYLTIYARHRVRLRSSLLWLEVVLVLLSYILVGSSVTTSITSITQSVVYILLCP